MSRTVRRGGNTSNPSHGSRTLTISDAQPREEGGPSRDAGSGAGPSDPGVIGSLNLRGGEGGGRRVMWTDDTVDNEGAGRKKSKSTSHAIFICSTPPTNQNIF
jgi:protein phosphatase 1 regulatory subunit 11